MAGEIQLNGTSFASESGGTITVNNATLGSAVLGIPTQVYAYGQGSNSYDGTKVKWGTTRVSSGITFGPSDDANATNFVPPSTGYYHINVDINFFNEPPSGTEDDSGTFTVDWQDSTIETLRLHFHITTSPTTAHEGTSISGSFIHQVTSVGSSTDYFNLKYTSFTVGNYNETYRMTIFKLS